MDDLSDRQRDILAFERGWWQHAGAKDSEILRRFGCSATRYYQELLAVIALPAALVHDPMTVKRLQRVRDGRARGRHPAGRRLG